MAVPTEKAIEILMNEDTYNNYNTLEVIDTVYVEVIRAEIRTWKLLVEWSDNTHYRPHLEKLEKALKFYEEHNHLLKNIQEVWDV